MLRGSTPLGVSAPYVLSPLRGGRTSAFTDTHTRPPLVRAPGGPAVRLCWLVLSLGRSISTMSPRRRLIALPSTTLSPMAIVGAIAALVWVTVTSRLRPLRVTAATPRTAGPYVDAIARAEAGPRAPT